TQSIGEAADLDSALSVALEQVCVFTGWEYGEAWMPNPQGRLLERAFTWVAGASGAREFKARSEGRSFSHGEGLPGRVWSSRQPLWLQDVTFLARASGLRAAVAIPVLSRPGRLSDGPSPRCCPSAATRPTRARSATCSPRARRASAVRWRSRPGGATGRSSRWSCRWPTGRRAARPS